MLAVVVAVFATLWLPYRALVVYNSFTFPPYMELWYANRRNSKKFFCQSCVTFVFILLSFQVPDVCQDNDLCQ